MKSLQKGIVYTLISLLQPCPATLKANRETRQRFIEGINENTKLMGWLLCGLVSVVGHKTKQRLGWGRPTGAGGIEYDVQNLLMA